jgi:hypothetical protein
VVISICPEALFYARPDTPDEAMIFLTRSSRGTSHP